MKWFGRLFKNIDDTAGCSGKTVCDNVYSCINITGTRVKSIGVYIIGGNLLIQ